MVCIKADPGTRTKDDGGVLNVTHDSVAPAPYALKHSDCGLDIKALAEQSWVWRGAQGRGWS